MKCKVEVAIMDGIELKKDAPEDLVITGRLLGAVSCMEATKIIQNEEVARRVATTESVRLKDALKALEKIEKSEVDTHKHGRLVVAVKKMDAETTDEAVNVITRQLYFTPPIVMVAQLAEIRGCMSASLDCGSHDELVIINESEDNND